MKQSGNYFRRVRGIGLLFAIIGAALFTYFIYQTGVDTIFLDIQKLGFGFALVLILYVLRLTVRSSAWMLCLEKPYKLSFFNAFQSVTIGEALSSMLPFGVVISGTAKAIAVRKQLPLVVGLSSLAIENFFYSLSTAVLLIVGASVFLSKFPLDDNLRNVGFALIAAAGFVIALFLVLIIAQWRFLSTAAKMFRGFGVSKSEQLKPENVPSKFDKFIEQIIKFEDNFYGFYRRNSRRFLPLMSLQFTFHLLGIAEIWLVLKFISDANTTFQTAFLLETVNRGVIVFFKFVPFALGVDEAGAQFVAETLGIGASIGVSLAIIRKGRVLFWAAIGVLLIANKGLSWRDF